MNTNNKKIILTIGNSHYILPYKEYKTNFINPNIISITLEDNSQIEISPNNIILIPDSSELIDAILESNSEVFYKPEETKYAKTKMKRLN